MIKLSTIFKRLLREQSENVIEFLNDNFHIALMFNEKKLVFQPTDASQPARNIHEYVKMVQDRFLVSKVNDYGNNILEVVLDPREDFVAAVDLMKTEAESENKA